MLSSLLLCLLGQATGDPLQLEAERLAQSLIILDGHIDLPYRLLEEPADVSKRTESGDFDVVRAREGGLNAPFMSIYIPASLEGKGAKAEAERLIDLVEGLARNYPNHFALARSPQDLRAHFAAGLISLPMGMENGAPIEGDLANLHHFFQRGIRYITLAHSSSNHICDSSYDQARPWRGLSPFGRQLVAEMNRLGIMIDVSHISDEAFAQVMELSAVPVIASHSSCRHFTPGFERNMSDAMIRQLATHGGVIQINFGSSFISDAYRKANDALREQLRQVRESEGEDAAKRRRQALLQAQPLPRAGVEDVADHVMHVVSLVGIDHVGLGSDFDGVGDSLPTGLRDVSQYPNLFRALLARGLVAKDLEKLASGNVLRVWQAVEDHAKSL
jgi:membrane dipeptidase